MNSELDRDVRGSSGYVTQRIPGGYVEVKTKRVFNFKAASSIILQRH